MFYEVVDGMSGLLDNRKPFSNLNIAVECAVNLSRQLSKHFLVYDKYRIVAIVNDKGVQYFD